MLYQEPPIPFHSDLKIFYQQYASVLQQKYPGISLHRLEEEITHYDFQEYEEFVHWQHALQQGIPLEYISGHAYFYKSEFLVNEHVLIPRSETEVLVADAVELLLHHKDWDSVLDMGTGSGAIAISIAQEIDRNLNLILSDISVEALQIAEINRWRLAYRYSSQHSLELLVSDRLSCINQQFHLIVTNPPYIKASADRSTVHSQVLVHEPEQALFLNDKIYDDWFRVLFSQAYDHLYEDGMFLMEGHELHLERLANLLNDQGFSNVAVKPDLSGRARFLWGAK